MPKSRSIGRTLRITGWVITIIGLIIFYGSLFFAFLIGFSPPHALSRAGLILSAVGCLWLIGSLLWPRTPKGSVAAEVALGILCLPPGLVALAETYGGELTRMAPFWLVITIFLLPGAIALIVQSTRVRHAAKQSRE